MTKEEFLNQFDIFYNNITSNQAPGLNPYEISVFLTKAQDEVLKSYFNPRFNKSQEGFDGSERRQIDFSMVLKEVTVSGANLSNDTFTTVNNQPKPGVKLANIPSDIMMFVNEFVDVTRSNRNIRLTAVPLDFASYRAMSSKPYKRPSQYQAWRLIVNSGSNKVRLIAGANDIINQYAIRYIKRPYPIILENLSNEGVSINGETTPYNDPISVLITNDVTVINNILDLQRMYEHQQIQDLRDVDSSLFAVYDSANDLWYKITNVNLTTYEATISYLTDAEESVLYSKLPSIPGDYVGSFIKTQLSEGDQVCELDPILHEEILQRAVELAKAAWEGSLNSQFAIGVNSATPMGVVPSGNNRQE